MGLATRLAEAIAQFLEPLPGSLIVFLLAAFPILELRGSIPFGIGVLGMGWPAALFYSLLGNIVIVPLIWRLFARLEHFGRRWGRLARYLDRLYERTHRRTRHRIETYEEIAVFFLVALPIPGAGAWTGALIVHVFDLPRHKSFWVIAAGLVASGLLVTAATVTGIRFFT